MAVQLAVAVYYDPINSKGLALLEDQTPVFFSSFHFPKWLRDSDDIVIQRGWILELTTYVSRQGFTRPQMVDLPAEDSITPEIRESLWTALDKNDEERFSREMHRVTRY
jgi:hypothetical protein